MNRLKYQQPSLTSTPSSPPLLQSVCPHPHHVLHLVKSSVVWQQHSEQEEFQKVMNLKAVTMIGIADTRLLVNHLSRCFIAVTFALHMKLWGVHSVCTQTQSSAPAECQHSTLLGTAADDNSSKQDQADKPGI